MEPHDPTTRADSTSSLPPNGPSPSESSGQTTAVPGDQTSAPPTHPGRTMTATSVGFLPAPLGLIAFVLASIVFYIYRPALRYDFINFDDPDYVTSNEQVKAGLTLKGIAWAFGTGTSGNWHPLTWISHMLDVQIFGVHAGGAHLVNVLLHLANTVLLLFLLHGMTRAAWRSALVAALFGLHPLHVESVAWIAERKDLLSAFFGLFALTAYSVYAREKPRKSDLDQPENQATRITKSNRHLWYGLALLFFALGLMSKPMLVTLPFVMLLLDFWPLDRLAWDWSALRGLFAEKIPFFALTLTSSVVTFVVQKHAGAMQSLSNYPASIRIENSIVSYARYLAKTCWPFNLATPYSHPGHWPSGPVLFASLLVAALCFAAFRLRSKFPFITTGWFWFFGMLVPVIGLIQVGAQSMADRYTYLPLIGLFIIIAWGLAEAGDRGRIPLALLALIGGLVPALCALRTHDQLRNWRNSEVLFVHATSVSTDNWIAHYNLACELHHQGRMDPAIQHYQRTLEIKPADVAALNNLGMVWVDQARFAEAIPYFEAALQIKPDFLEARDNLGKCLVEVGKPSEAIAQFQRVLKAKSDHVGALNNLAHTLVAQGNPIDALPLYEKSLHAKPNQASAHYDLGHTLVRLRRFDEAIDHYRLALASNPDFAEAHHDLGIALAMQGKLEEASAQLREAIRTKPANAAFHRSLAKALLAAGHTPEAVEQYREALRLKPDFVQARTELDALEAKRPK